MSKKRLGCLGTLILGPVLLVLVVILTTFVSVQESCDTQNLSADVALTSSNASDTDWTHEGSVAYTNAKKVFDSWTSKGLSGSAAAGIVGWVNSEGGFSLVDRAEGHYGLDEVTNGLSAGVIPSGGLGYSTGGGGIYQFTPYTKFAPAGDPKWLDVDAQNTFVAKAILAGDWNASMDLTGGNHSFQQLAQMTDPKQATLVWQAYERGNTAAINQAQKQADAQKAYDMFGGASISYHADTFAKAFGATGTDLTSSTESGIAITTSCDSGGSGTWDTDGGTVNYSAHNAWKKDDLPDDLKSYALSPESLGLSYRSKTGWQAIASTGGQCTDLSASLMYALWQKKGSHPKMTSGNGQDIAKNWAKAFGGLTSSTPKAGAVFSETPSAAGNDVGHTGVVSHLFSNGDILVVEQNYAALSGENEGFGKYTWSYRYVPTSQYQHGWSFYDPSQAGYNISDNASSVG